MKDWADKYHVWGPPTRSPSRSNSRQFKHEFFHTKKEHIDIYNIDLYRLYCLTSCWGKHFLKWFLSEIKPIYKEIRKIRIILLFSLKKEVSNSPWLAQKKRLPFHIVYKRISVLLFCFEKMMFAKLTVLFSIFRAVQCIEPEVCSNIDEVFRGIARDRYVISSSKTVRLDVSKLSTVCDAGVNCREFCLLNSLEWNFFEVKKVCPNHT